MKSIKINPDVEPINFHSFFGLREIFDLKGEIEDLLLHVSEIKNADVELINVNNLLCLNKILTNYINESLDIKSLD